MADSTKEGKTKLIVEKILLLYEIVLLLNTPLASQKNHEPLCLVFEAPNSLDLVRIASTKF